MELRGIDLYTYVGNNPIGGSDASGFDPGDGNSADDTHNADRDAAFYAMDHDWENPNTAYRSRYAQDRNSQLPGEGGYQKLNYVVGPVAGQVAQCTPWGAEEGAVAREGESAAEEAQNQAWTGWGNPDTLTDHFQRHGGDIAAADEDAYTNMSGDFLNSLGDPGVQGKLDPSDGTIRAYEPSSNTFGSYNPDGSTKTFFKPASPGYWANQPGIPF